MDELYVVARRALLDALDALAAHRDAIVVVGAQAIYLRVGDADLAVAPYTTDCDLALDPALLAEIPPLEHALAAARLVSGGKDAVGVWFAHVPTSTLPDVAVQIDLLVPETISPGKGRRAARLRGHDANAARIVRGLEGAIVDFDTMRIAALDPTDTRVVHAKVAGPAALLIAKLHKISERKGTARANDKDALDVFRLLRGVPTADFATRYRFVLADARSREAAERGRAMVADLLHRGGAAAAMAADAAAGFIDPDEVRLSCELLSQDLLAALAES